MNGNIEISDLDGNFCVECKEKIGYDSDNELIHALVLSKFTNNLEGTAADYLTPDPVSEVKSMPSKEELDFVNDFIDCADCEEFVSCEVPETDNALDLSQFEEISAEEKRLSVAR
jgi:hypothetical protein